MGRVERKQMTERRQRWIIKSKKLLGIRKDRMLWRNMTIHVLRKNGTELVGIARLIP